MNPTLEIEADELADLLDACRRAETEGDDGDGATADERDRDHAVA